MGELLDTFKEEFLHLLDEANVYLDMADYDELVEWLRDLI